MSRGNRSCTEQGAGALVERAPAEAAGLKARRVGIEIIAEHTELKEWYEGIGFTPGESRDFPHLPFRVTFLSYTVDERRP